MSGSALIALVQQYEELYNTQHPQYGNQQRRDSVWEEIAEQLAEDIITCKEKWQRIRENFRKAILLRKTKRGRSANTLKSPKYSEELSFLREYLKDEDRRSRYMARTPRRFSRSPLSGVDSTEGEAQHSDSSSTNALLRVRTPAHNSSYTPYTATSSTSVHAPTAPPNTTENSNSVQNPSSDPLVDFFITMAKTVKEFPLKKQLEIKSALFEMVHNVEIELSNEDTSSTFILPEIEIIKSEIE